MGFFNPESMGQASALDILFFALLVSLSTLMITAYGSSHQADADMEELRGRYAMDLARGFALSARYVTDTEDEWMTTYTLGKGDLCLGDSMSIIYRLSNVTEHVSSKSPMRRYLRSSLLDLIADDLYFSLSIYTDSVYYSLSNSVFTGCFHRQLEATLRIYLSFLFGGAFDYRIDASWHPFEGSELDGLIYSSVFYGEEVVPDDLPVYVFHFQIPIPLDEEGLYSLEKSLHGYLRALTELEGVITNSDEKEYEEILTAIQKKWDSSHYPLSDRAFITFKIWPKEASYDA
jgi:hypothetical protein